MDIIYINSPSMGGSNYWVLIVDQATKFKWSFFVKFKDEMAETISEMIKKIIASGKEVIFVRCDKAGENKMIEK